MLQVIARYSTKNTAIEYGEAVKEFISIASDIAGAEEPIIKIIMEFIMNSLMD